MAVGRRTLVRSAGLRYSPSPPRGGRREDAEGGLFSRSPSAESPSGAGAANSSSIVARGPAKRCDVYRVHGVCWLRDGGDCFGSLVSFLSFPFFFFSGCVAQMVERSLRMRQVLGSMPSASIRERRRKEKKGTGKNHEPRESPHLPLPSSFLRHIALDRGPRATERRLFFSLQRQNRLPGRSQR